MITYKGQKIKNSYYRYQQQLYIIIMYFYIKRKER